MSEDKATKDNKDKKVEAEVEKQVKEETVKPLVAKNTSFDPNKKPPFRKKFSRGGRFGNGEREEKIFDEKVVTIDRVTRVVKGGRRMRFRALVVVGDKKGRIGYGIGKGNEVIAAVKKGTDKAKKTLMNVEIIDGTLAHDVEGFSRGAKVLLKYARKGRGIIAGGSVRVVLELAGFEDVVAKSFGSTNKINNVRATLDAFSSLLKYKRMSKTPPKKKSEEKEVEKVEKDDKKEEKKKLRKNK